MAKQPAHLPRPDAGTRDVVIYDADCPICRGSVERLHRLDWFGRVAFLPLDDEEVARRWPGLSREELLRSVHVVRPDGRIDRGAAAVRRLARRVPGLWPLVPLLHLPGTLPIWQRMYHWVSEHRYAVSGGEQGECPCDDRES